MDSIENGRKVLKVEKYSKLNGGIVATSVKLSERGKRMLDSLQAEVTLKSRSKISQQELLEIVLTNAEERKGEIISKVTNRPKFPFSESDIKKILSLVGDWGVVTCEEDIDKYLYGKE